MENILNYSYSSRNSNTVLKNTYWLLALSMIPTILGAFIGLKTGILNSLGSVVTMLIFFIGAMGLMFMVEKNKESKAGIGWLLGFTFFMGIMLSNLIGSILGLSNGAFLIMTAFAGTASVFFGMSILSTVIKKDLSNMGKFLFVGAIILMVLSISNVFFQSSIMHLALSGMAILIFSGFLLYDLNRIANGGETNYISATLSLYLSLYNIFQSLLSILGIFGGNRD